MRAAGPRAQARRRSGVPSAIMLNGKVSLLEETLCSKYNRMALTMIHTFLPEVRLPLTRVGLENHVLVKSGRETRI